MKCDICGNEHSHTDMLEFPHRQIQAVTMAGFVPNGFISLAKRLYPTTNPEEYWRDIVSRYDANSYWAMCRSCQSEMQQFARKLMGL